MRVRDGGGWATLAVAGSLAAAAVVVLITRAVATADFQGPATAGGILAAGLLAVAVLVGAARMIGPATALLGGWYVVAHLSGPSVSGAALVAASTGLFLAAELAYWAGESLRQGGAVASVRAVRLFGLAGAAIVTSSAVVVSARRLATDGVVPLLMGAGAMLALAAAIAVLARRSAPVHDETRLGRPVK